MNKQIFFLCSLKHCICGVYIMKPVSVFHDFMVTVNDLRVLCKETEVM